MRTGSGIGSCLAVALAAAALAPVAAHGISQPVSISSQANVFGAGHASPPAPGGNGAGTLPPVVSLPAGSARVVRFPSLTGTAFASCSNAVSNGPDGSCNALGTNVASVGGLAGLISAANMMVVGVFLGPDEPADPAPARLDFRPTALGQSFADLSPGLEQAFFIGDGKTSGGALQRFHAPAGASRLFVGIADGFDFQGSVCCYADNSGGFEGTVDVSAPLPPTTPPVTPPGVLPPPVLGRRVNVTPVRGKVFVSLPGNASARASQSVPGLKGRRFVPLSAARQIPVGSLLDTRKGVVRLQSALASAGKTQSGEFSSGVFDVRQSPRASARGLTHLRLRGGSFARCGSARGGAVAAARSRRVIRRTRSNVRRGSRWKITANRVAGTARGTVWTTIDRCDTSVVKVRRGVVAVRDFRLKKTFRIREDESFVGCAPGFRTRGRQAPATVRGGAAQRRLRRLRSNTRGLFRTCGRFSAATVRGG